MLDDKIREAARLAIQPRFELLDQTLDDQLDELTASARRLTRADELAHVGVKVRLVCEHDLNERAFAAWRAIRRAHEAMDHHRSDGLLKAIKSELHLYMADACVNLANRLADHADALAPTFSGSQPLDPAWLRRMQRLAEEKQMKEMEQYVSHLHRSLKSWVSGRD